MIVNILNLALNPVIGLAAAIFIAYFGLDSGTGLFAALPAAITEVFSRNEWVQFVALVVVLAALVAKVLVMKELKRRRTAGSREA